MNTAVDLVVPTQPVSPADRGAYDLYLPDGVPCPPVVVVVHGLFPQRPPVLPRQTAFFRSYAAQLVQRGVAAVVLDHELVDGMRYPEAAATLDRTLSAVRADPALDSEHVAVWFFSGGGPLSYPVLAAGHDWLRCVGLTYPLLPTQDIPGWPSLTDALAGLADTPVVLTRVEHEIPDFVSGQQALVDAAPAGLETIEVPAAQHGFDTGPDTEHARAAVLEALDRVAGHVVGAAARQG